MSDCEDDLDLFCDGCGTDFPHKALAGPCGRCTLRQEARSADASITDEEACVSGSYFRLMQRSRSLSHMHVLLLQKRPQCLGCGQTFPYMNSEATHCGACAKKGSSAFDILPETYEQNPNGVLFREEPQDEGYRKVLCWLLRRCQGETACSQSFVGSNEGRSASQAYHERPDAETPSKGQ